MVQQSYVRILCAVLRWTGQRRAARAGARVVRAGVADSRAGRPGLGSGRGRARSIGCSPRRRLPGRIEPLITLSVDMRDVYPPTHWAIDGRPPAYDTPDEDVYLEGRNIVLVAKAGVMCASLGVERLALGPLAGNPFPDATPEFFEAMSRAMSLGLAQAAHDRHAALGDAQGRGRGTGPDARRAARAHALVHESVAGRTSVRPVQQVSRARRRVPPFGALTRPERRTSNFKLRTSELRIRTRHLEALH